MSKSRKLIVLVRTSQKDKILPLLASKWNDCLRGSSYKLNSVSAFESATALKIEAQVTYEAALSYRFKDLSKILLPIDGGVEVLGRDVKDDWKPVAFPSPTPAATASPAPAETKSSTAEIIAQARADSEVPPVEAVPIAKVDLAESALKRLAVAQLATPPVPDVFPVAASKDAASAVYPVPAKTKAAEIAPAKKPRKPRQRKVPEPEPEPEPQEMPEVPITIAEAVRPMELPVRSVPIIEQPTVVPEQVQLENLSPLPLRRTYGTRFGNRGAPTPSPSPIEVPTKSVYRSRW